MSHLIWTVIWQDMARPDRSFGAVATPVPALMTDSLPAEVGLLLPNRDSQSAELALIEDVSRRRAAGPGIDPPALGLFLANPFLRTAAVASACRSAGIDWVVNLPSVGQQDPEFTQQLEDVGLDIGGELRRLKALRQAGLRIAAVVTDPDGARQALAVPAEVLIVLPRVSEFAVGFPSSRQRGAAIQSIRAVLADTDWRGPVLGLGDDTEAAHSALWPEGADGILVRPKQA